MSKEELLKKIKEYLQADAEGQEYWHKMYAKLLLQHIKTWEKNNV